MEIQHGERGLGAIVVPTDTATRSRTQTPPRQARAKSPPAVRARSAVEAVPVARPADAGALRGHPGRRVVAGAAQRGRCRWDNVTCDAFERNARARLARLRRSLWSGNYVPGPVRRVEVMKETGGTRPLSIPCVADRIVQTAVAFTLAPVVEPAMSPASFGYRPGLGVQNAVERVIELRRREKRGWVLESDVARFFETVPHVPLLELIEARTGDARVTELVAVWLEASGTGGRGLLQGSPLSPLLANLYLDEVDHLLDAPDARLVRYADDLVILARRRADAELARKRVAGLMRSAGWRCTGQDAPARLRRRVLVSRLLHHPQPGAPRPEAHAGSRAAGLGPRRAARGSGRGERAAGAGKTAGAGRPVGNHARAVAAWTAQGFVVTGEPEGMPDCVRFRLTGARLPDARIGHQVAERARRATLGRARLMYGSDGIPTALSGHDLMADAPAREHRHAFWLPEDTDGDGRIDHVTVHARAMNGLALAALLAADIAIYSRRENWRANWNWIGRQDDDDVPTPLLDTALVWVSVAPYYRPWHAKRGFSQDQMIRRECAARGLPPLAEVDLLASGAPPPRWRWRHSAPTGNARGTAWRLLFDAPVRGPLALGYSCHFGLGLFSPAYGDA